jgi:hypothetical protein
MARMIRKITVTAIGTPPPLPLRPLADEVLWALEQRRRPGSTQSIEYLSARRVDNRPGDRACLI